MKLGIFPSLEKHFNVVSVAVMICISLGTRPVSHSRNGSRSSQITTMFTCFFLNGRCSVRL